VVGICFLVLFLSGTASVAQTVTGSVRGTVSDPTGAAVLGARVTITNTGTGVVGKTVSDKSGLYDFEFLVLGDYTVIVFARQVEPFGAKGCRLRVRINSVFWSTLIQKNYSCQEKTTFIYYLIYLLVYRIDSDRS
jgi:hypothetical protein